MQGLDAYGSITLIVVGVAIAIFLFALIRSVLLWYFKLDHISTRLDESVSALNRIAEALERLSPPP